jgi:hypothetical protein
MTTATPGAKAPAKAGTRRAATAPAGAVPTQRRAPAAEHDVLTEAATVVALPFTLARQLVPDTVVPVALSAGALAVVGAIEWPAAVAVTLGYLALRRWRRPTPGAA